MTKLITPFVLALAAVLAAPAMAASHTGGAPMKADEPAAGGSAPAKHHKKSSHKDKAHKETAKKDDAAKKTEAPKQ